MFPPGCTFFFIPDHFLTPELFCIPKFLPKIDALTKTTAMLIKYSIWKKNKKQKTDALTQASSSGQIPILDTLYTCLPMKAHLLSSPSP